MSSELRQTSYPVSGGYEISMAEAGSRTSFVGNHNFLSLMCEFDQFVDSGSRFINVDGGYRHLSFLLA